MKEATRYDPDYESSLLDLILTHHEDDVKNLYYMPPLSKSDNSVLVFDCHATVTNKNVSAYARLNTWKANIQYIVHSASSVDYLT